MVAPLVVMVILKCVPRTYLQKFSVLRFRWYPIMQRGKIFRDLFLGWSNGAETEGASEREILWNNEEMNREVRKNILFFNSLSIKLSRDHFFDEFIP